MIPNRYSIPPPVHPQQDNRNRSKLTKASPLGPRVTATASASLSMPAASPRRQASPVDMTLTSARTTRRRPTLADLGSSCWDEDEKPAAGAKETAVRYIAAAAGTECEHARGRAATAGPRLRSARQKGGGGGAQWAVARRNGEARRRGEAPKNSRGF